MTKNVIQVGIFADGSATIGAGHQVRTRALAEALIAAGHQVRLCCRDLPGSPHGWAWQGLPLVVLPADLSPRAALAQCPGDLLVVDHYDIAGEDLPTDRLVIVIDDVPGRALQQAAIVLNQNLGVPADAYGERGRVGPTYALLRGAFVGRQWRATPAASHSASVLVMLGGTDHRRLAGTIATHLAAAGLPVLAISREVVSGPGIEVSAVMNAEELASALATCRAAVFGAGSAVWEALCVGAPLVAVHTVGNQDCIVAGLRAKNLARVLEPSAVSEVAAAVLAARPPPPGLVDGLGAARMVTIMEQLCRA